MSYEALRWIMEFVSVGKREAEALLAVIDAEEVIEVLAIKIQLYTDSGVNDAIEFAQILIQDRKDGLF